MLSTSKTPTIIIITQVKNAGGRIVLRDGKVFVQPAGILDASLRKSLTEQKETLSRLAATLELFGECELLSSEDAHRPVNWWMRPENFAYTSAYWRRRKEAGDY